jgi:6-phosphogluconolactonase (cycloisomerase 2 family)
MMAGGAAASMLGCAGRTVESAAGPEGTRAGAAPRGPTVLYSAVGEVMTRYEVDVSGFALTRRESVKLPANIQYVWPHPSRQYLYVTSSSSGPGASGLVGTQHHLSAFRILPGGALQPHGEARALPSRPIHNSLDATGSYALTAYNNPSAVTVHRVNRDGTLGEEVRQPHKPDAGIFAHQVLAMPSNRAVILVARGNDAVAKKPEDPGALKIYRFDEGVLTNLATVAPNGGQGYGPRHLDFHPAQPWVYVSVERQNKLHVYRRDGNTLAGAPMYSRDTLAEPHNERPRQLGGAIRVHPGGRTVYTSNRADSTVEVEGRRVFRGGENSLAVFSIDPRSGEPTLIQHADTRGIHVRTFSIDPSGRMLVAASIMPLAVRDGSRIVDVPAGLMVFRIGGDGKLDFVRKYDLETGGKTQFWSGMIALNN